MEELYGILSGCRPDIDFKTQTGLIDNGLLESLDIVMIVEELDLKYDIEISVDDLVPENFNDAGSIYALVQRLREEN